MTTTKTKNSTMITWTFKDVPLKYIDQTSVMYETHEIIENLFDHKTKSVCYKYKIYRIKSGTKVDMIIYGINIRKIKLKWIQDTGQELSEMIAKKLPEETTFEWYSKMKSIHRKHTKIPEEEFDKAEERARKK